MHQLERIIIQSLSHLINEEVVKVSVNILIFMTISRSLYKKLRVKKVVKKLSPDLQNTLKEFNNSFRKVENELSDLGRMFSSTLKSFAAMSRARKCMRHIQRLSRSIDRISNNYMKLIENCNMIIKYINISKELRNFIGIEIPTSNSLVIFLSEEGDYIREIRKSTYFKLIIGFTNAIFDLLYRYIRAENDLGKSIAKKRLEGFRNCSELLLRSVKQLLLNMYSKIPITPPTNIRSIVLNAFILKISKEIDEVKERSKKEFLLYKLEDRIYLIESIAKSLKQIVSRNLNLQ